MRLISICLCALTLTSFSCSKKSHPETPSNNGAVTSTTKTTKKSSLTSSPVKNVYYSSSNGFAGWRKEWKAAIREDGKYDLTFVDENYFRNSGTEDPTITYTGTADVGEQLHKILEDGHIEKYRNHYQPEFDITDGTSWSFSATFMDKVNISSGGYMEWPDDRSAINNFQKLVEENVEGLPEK